MKKFLSILLALCFVLSPFTVLADDATLNIDPLMYDEYAYGETITITGTANRHVALALFPPEDGASAKYINVFTPDELAEGIELPLGTAEDSWSLGVWRIIVQYGEAKEELEFTLSETVDRTDKPSENPTDKPSTNKPSGRDNTVTTIIPEKNEITLHVGETAKINITSQASSLSAEVDNSDILTATLSGKTLTVTALRVGESQIWIQTSNNYASITVTVVIASEEEPTEPVEKPTEPVENNPFTDLPSSHWAKNSILSLYEKGIINGMTETAFAPDEFVTRAQFVTMLQKAFDLSPKFPLSPFDDVKESDWYYTAVIAAYDNGVATGYGGKFNPNSLITRQDMATFAYRAATASGKELSLSFFTPFADDTQISDYAKTAVYSMRSVGVINGMTEDTFAPLGNATRAQAAHIIAKLLELD